MTERVKSEIKEAFKLQNWLPIVLSLIVILSGFTVFYGQQASRMAVLEASMAVQAKAIQDTQAQIKSMTEQYQSLRRDVDIHGATVVAQLSSISASLSAIDRRLDRMEKNNR